MDREREEQAAFTEAAFRIANERMARWEERHRDGRAERYYCECALADCRGTVELGRSEYESVRGRSERFVVIMGHVLPDLEQVVDRGEGYEVIEKPAALHGLLAQADPRRPEQGRGEDVAERRAQEMELVDDDRAREETSHGGHGSTD